MNAIIVMTRLALETPLNREQREFLEAVASASRSLLGLVNDILDFSRIEAGRCELHPAPFSLRGGLMDVLRMLAVRAHRKGIELAGYVPPHVPDRLLGDADRLRQVLVNLIGNAIKFTAEGDVTVRVDLEGGSDGSGTLHFAIADTGIGIPADKQEDIFQAFVQVDGSQTRAYGGAGLGLTIAARIVDAMGGRIGVESEVGRGSVFRFAMQIGGATGEPPTIRVPALAGVPVLVAGAHGAAGDMLLAMLHDLGLQPSTAVDVRAGLGTAAAAGHPFRLALLDAPLSAPEMSAVIEHAREACREYGTPLVVLGSPLRGAESTLSGWLPKPVDAIALQRALRSALCPEDVPAVVPPAAGERAARPLSVLVAEDDAYSRALVVHLLEGRGHAVTAVEDGASAVATVETTRFDVVLLDIQMPGMSGLDAAAALRALEPRRTPSLPIVALTAHAGADDRARCLRAGFDAFMSKPVDIGELVALVEALGAQAGVGGAGAAAPQ
jgi:CheY-like chemotaxis protein